MVGSRTVWLPVAGCRTIELRTTWLGTLELRMVGSRTVWLPVAGLRTIYLGIAELHKAELHTTQLDIAEHGSIRARVRSCLVLALSESSRFRQARCVRSRA